MSFRALLFYLMKNGPNAKLLKCTKLYIFYTGKTQIKINEQENYALTKQN